MVQRKFAAEKTVHAKDKQKEMLALTVWLRIVWRIRPNTGRDKHTVGFLLLELLLLLLDFLLLQRINLLSACNAKRIKGADHVAYKHRSAYE